MKQQHIAFDENLTKQTYQNIIEKVDEEKFLKLRKCFSILIAYILSKRLI